MRQSRVWLVFLCLVGCDGGSTPAPGSLGTLSHEFPAFDVGVGEEIRGMCHSWTLNNEEPIYVNAVRLTTNGSFHHGNFFFVPERMYPGEDGTWRCRDRGFDEIAAGIAGGVFFAQTTQVTSEEQRFPDGAVFQIPPHSTIVGDVHLLNTSGVATRTSWRFDVEPIRESEVVTELSPMSITYLALNLPPRSASEYSTTCSFGAGAATPFPEADFKIYYFLPHYHGWGRQFRMSVVGGPNDGRTIFEAGGLQGDPLGQTMDPAYDMTGATGLRMTCNYMNDRDTPLPFGFEDGEMCVVLAYTDSRYTFAGFVRENTVLPPDGDIAMNEGPCMFTFFATPSMR